MPTTKKPAPKKKVVAKAQPTTATDKQAELQKQIEALQVQMEALSQEAVQELKGKLSEARKVVSELEDELATLTGKSTDAPKGKRTRRASISDEHLQPQILTVMAKLGKEGLNAKQLGEHLHQDALRIRKFITANSKTLKRVGNGPGTKFFLP